MKHLKKKGNYNCDEHVEQQTCNQIVDVHFEKTCNYNCDKRFEKKM